MSVVAGMTLAAVPAGGRRGRADRGRRGRRSYKDLGLTQLAAMPSGRVLPTGILNATNNWGYRTYEQMNTEMDALAAANPNLVKVKTAARKSVEGRDIKYMEITNNVSSPPTASRCSS